MTTSMLNENGGSRRFCRDAVVSAHLLDDCSIDDFTDAFIDVHLLYISFQKYERRYRIFRYIVGPTRIRGFAGLVWLLILLRN